MARTRTFIALDPGKAIRESIGVLQEKLAQTGAEVKWVEPENLHVTLLFLGEVHERDLLGVCRAVTKVANEFPPITLSVEGTGCFPNARRPRTLWVGVGAGREEVIALHDALEKPLLELRCYRREERGFTPHITLGRVKSDEPLPQLTMALQKYQDWQAGDFIVNQVLVMGSQLTPSGPEYAVLSRAKFHG